MRRRRPRTGVPLAAALLAAVAVGCSAPGGPTPSSPGTTGPSATGSAMSPTAGPSITGVPTAEVTPQADAIEAVSPTDGSLSALWVGPDVVLAGGAVGAAVQPTILRFAGGAWTNVDVPVEWQGVPGQVMGIAEVGGTFFAVGNELPDKRRGFVWFSVDDGATWELSLAVENAALYDIAASGSTVVVVGAHLDAENSPTAAAWSSPNRESWLEAEIESASGQAIGSVTATTGGFAAVGTGATTSASDLTAWRTTDGATWTATQPDLPPLQLPTGLVEGPDGRLTMSGASGKSGDPQLPFVARSADGAAWERTLLSEEEGYASAIEVADAALVVAGVDADRLTIWTEQAADWQPEVIEQTGAAINELAWDPLVGLVAVGSKDGHYAVWLLRGPP